MYRFGVICNKVKYIELCGFCISFLEAALYHWHLLHERALQNSVVSTKVLLNIFLFRLLHLVTALFSKCGNSLSLLWK